jgi:hypothetical protein
MYVPVLWGVPDQFVVETTDDGFIVSVGLAESVDGDRQVAVEISLCPADWQGTQIHELSFQIAVSSLDGCEEPFTTQDRTAARGYLPEEVGDLVVPSVCAAAEELSNVVNPPFIFRVTKGRGLPEKALYKHHLITDTLLGIGFEVVQTGTDELGRLFWLLERP